jgi:hypothetical protein
MLNPRYGMAIMTDQLPNPSIRERAQALQAKRAEILALPPEQALGRILNDPQPAALVHSFPETDFYFLLHDIGPEDALPLLALASDKQWDHIVDLESWARDRIEVNQLTRWMSRLMEADPRRFIRWFLKDRLAFGEFCLFHTLEVRIREHDQDPSEFGEGFFTLDQVYYIRFLKMPPAGDASAVGEEERKAFLEKLLHLLAEHDHLLFQGLLLEATHIIPAETEEEELRWRNVRLAEKGFVPFDEAIGIYQPVTRRQLESQRPKSLLRDSGDEAVLLPVPAYPLHAMAADTHFSRALALIEPGPILTRLQWEFANLCNQIIVADHKTVRSREQLREIVAKACGYISMGLERMKSSEDGPPEPAQAAAALTRHPLVQLFRLGFGGALEVKWQAERWLSSSWFAKAGLKLGFWGEQWMGALGGILLKKPQYYDNYQTGVLYREFASLQDVARTGSILKQVQAVDHLLAVMDIKLGPPVRYSLLTWKNLLLTQWVRHGLGLGEETLRPLALSEFAPFFEKLLPGTPSAGVGGTRRIPDPIKTDFISWLSHETGLKDFEISEKLGRIFEDLFAEIEAEYGRVAATDLDPRFVQLFLLKR